ncbi:hypothetical protein PENDEC_c003G01350 [Penicillium decumbens]|uniref:Homologous-pairing protein 2 winged helix domain-containing protein n=1 Tax=Penicillium decumbens TaxID=69771 RepID=A0A1V6PIC7_PENDC|nr:hypothetical protein PENDEC_c003G01350 [Penicillium decumbens]
MGTRKGKSDASAGADDTTMILDYLREQNMPSTCPWLRAATDLADNRFGKAIEVSANLHNKVTRVKATKLLRELHQNGKIEERVAGKQVVYHAVQGSSDEATPEILAALSQEIEQLQGQLSSAKEDEKKARASLAALEAKPRLSALRQDIQRLEEEKEEIQARLGTLHDSDTVQLSLEERSKLEEEWRQWQRHAAIRRRICLDLWARCTELLPENTSSSELWETLGLEPSPQ